MTTTFPGQGLAGTLGTQPGRQKAAGPVHVVIRSTFRVDTATAQAFLVSGQIMLTVFVVCFVFCLFEEEEQEITRAVNMKFVLFFS